MANLTLEERAEMIRIAEETFNDECTIRRVIGTTKNEFGEETATYLDFEHVACGLLLPGTKAFEREVEQVSVLQADALLRISLDQPIGVNDEVVIRNKNFQVDAVVDGTTVRIVPLKSMELLE